MMMTALILKHFICDFPLQSTPYMYGNKGKYGHLGGILHAGIHTIGTFLALFFFTDVYVALTYAFADGLIHYHIDWAKMNLSAKFGLKPDNSEWFWILLGLDQVLHYLTYVFIVYQITGAIV